MSKNMNMESFLKMGVEEMLDLVNNLQAQRSTEKHHGQEEGTTVVDLEKTEAHSAMTNNNMVYAAQNIETVDHDKEIN